MKKLLFLFNPYSGTGAIGKHLAEVLDIFTKADYDGVLDGLFIRMPKTVHEFEQLRNSLITRNFDANCMYFIRADRFKIDSAPTVWTLDGENGGEYTQIEITTAVKAIRIALPEER